MVKIVSLSFASFLAYFSFAQNSGWITLIDGTEGMDNFNIVGDANWHTDASSIRATEGSGASWLVTKESYSDFVLRVEFWASHDANSGIYMRCPCAGKHKTNTGSDGFYFSMRFSECFLMTL